MAQHELGQSSANLSPDTVAEQAKGAVSDVAREARATGSSLRKEASGLGNTIKQGLSDQVERQKNGIADRLSVVAERVQRTAGDLRSKKLGSAACWAGAPRSWKALPTRSGATTCRASWARSRCSPAASRPCSWGRQWPWASH